MPTLARDSSNNSGISQTYQLLKYNSLLKRNVEDTNSKKNKNVQEIGKKHQHPSLNDPGLDGFGHKWVPKVDEETYYKKFRVKAIKKNWVEWICIRKKHNYDPNEINIKDES